MPHYFKTIMFLCILFLIVTTHKLSETASCNNFQEIKPLVKRKV